MPIPAGIIAIWRGTLATIPAGWDLCDGNGGRPNLLAKFLRGAPAATDPGGEGGTEAHTHTEAGTGGAHDHTGTSGSDGAHQHTTPTTTGAHAHGSNYFDAWATVTFQFVSVEGDHNHTWANEGAHTHAIDEQGAHSHILQNASTLPAYYQVAFIYSDGTAANFAQNIILLWSGTRASIPAGWSHDTTITERFLRGVPDGITNPGGTGGVDSHTHTMDAGDGAHTHTLATGSTAHTHTSSSAGDHDHYYGPKAYAGGSSRIGITNAGNHTHTCESDGGHSHTAASTGLHIHTMDATDGRPPFHELAPIIAGAGGALRKIGNIAIWTGLLANIPTDWTLCDGGGSRPDLREKFIRMVAAATDPGTTGGDADHTHADQGTGDHVHTIDEQGAHTHTAIDGSWSHTHGVLYKNNTEDGLIWDNVSGGAVHNHGDLSSTGAHDGHSITTSGDHSDHTFNNTASLPTYYQVAFIYATTDELLTDSEDLYAKFEVNASADLFAKAVIRNVGAQDLFAKFEVQETRGLFCHFWVAASGFLSTRMHRKGIVIKPASTSQTDYPVQIIAHYGSGIDSGADVYLNNKCTVDFGDVVFTAKDGTTLLDFWMQSKVNGDTAIFWVEVDSIPTGVGNPIYIYYGGYTKARTASDIETTFSFGDDFDDDEIDPAKWNCATHGSGGSYAEQTQEMALHASDNLNGSATAKTVPTFTKGIAIEFRAAASEEHYYGLTLGTGNIVGDGCGGTDWWHTFLDEGYICCVQGNVDFQYRYAHCPAAIDISENNIDGPDVPTYYYFRVIYTVDGDFKWYWSADGITYALLGSGYNETTYLDTAKNIMFYRGGWNGGARGGWLGISHVFVRKYVNAQPTPGRWSEEQENSLPFQNLWAKFQVGQDSANLYAKFIVNASADLFAKAVIRNVASQNLYGKFIVQHAASQNLYAKFSVQGMELLFAKFVVQQIGSQNLFATFDVNDSGDLYAKFIVQHAASQNLLGKLIVRQAASQNLFATFDVNDSEDLYAKFIVQHAASQNLYAKFSIQGVELLFAKFIVRQAASQNLLGKFVVRHPSSQNLFGKFVVRIAASADLFGKAVIRHAGAPRNLFSKFVVRYATSQDLFAKSIIRHAAGQDLYAKLILRNIGSQNLFAKFIVRKASSQNLLAKFTVRHLGSANLFAKLHLQRSVDLYAKFDVNAVVDLFAKFVVRKIAAQNLYAKFIVRHAASADLFGKAVIRNIGSQNLSAKFIVRQAASANLFSKFIINASADLFAKFEVRQSGSQNLFATFFITEVDNEDLYTKFVVRHADSVDLFAKFICRNVGSANLRGHFIVQIAASQNLFAKLVVRHPSSQDLFAKSIIRHAASQNVLGKLAVRHAASQDLFSKFIVRHAASADLFIKFICRNVGSANLRGYFIVRHVASQNLFAKLIVQHAASQNLYAKFVCRNVGSQDLFCNFEVGQGWEDLFCNFEVGQGWEDLLCKFSVRHIWYATGPYCKFVVRHASYERLFVTCYIRPGILTTTKMIIHGQDRRLILGGTDREFILGGRKRRGIVR